MDAVPVPPPPPVPMVTVSPALVRIDDGKAFQV
jgi:hypothetical protein